MVLSLRLKFAELERSPKFAATDAQSERSGDVSIAAGANGRISACSTPQIYS
jgi:hypothetical protein